MYKIEFNGCLTSLFIILLILFLLKELWWLIAGVILIAVALYYGNVLYGIIMEKRRIERETYNPQMGEVYKICPYCNTKVKVTAVTCPCCHRALN